MSSAMLEHVNYTVSDPARAADELVRIFGWKVRWRGPSLGGGTTVHVGTDDRYLALYTPAKAVNSRPESYSISGGLNHVGVLVDDLAVTEKRVLETGYKTHSHQTYDPGSRFYFHNSDGIEFEVVSYSNLN